MRDPKFAPLFIEIESHIVAADRAAREAGIPFTDSQVRSVLVRLRKNPLGQTEGGEKRTPREIALASLASDVACPTPGKFEMGGTRRVPPPADWSVALKIIENSIRIHTRGPGSRAYLEFVEGFIDSVRKEGL